MKVGLYADLGSPHIGGGYRFQLDVASALLSADGLRHTFHPIVDSDAAAAGWEAGPLRARPIDIRRTRTERAANRVRRLVSQGARDRLRRGRWWEGSRSTEDFITQEFSRHGVGALLSLRPDAVPTFRLPFVTVVWDLQHRLQPLFPEVSSAGEWEGREAAYGLILRRASAVVTGTERGKAEIERFYGVATESVFVIPFPTPSFASTSISDTGVERPADLRARYLFYPAQFWPHKNHVVLLRALKLLRESGDTDIKLVLAGSDRGNKAHVEGVARELGLAEGVVIEGFVSQSRLSDLYRHAEALVFPSYFGPDNLPPLEAFALGTPVIAARVPGAEEQLGDAALLVDPRSPADWAEAVRRIVREDGLKRSLVEKGRRRASSRTLANYVEGLGAVFDHIEPMRDCWPL